ncbi:hypothetical protein ACQ4PT_059151 [Festuca glaucescens]
MSGLPMICWPLYAEQALNKVFMVEEMKIAVALAGYETGMVKAEEVEAKVRLVMETEEGKRLREMLVAARKMASDAIGHGRSSEVAFAEGIWRTAAWRIQLIKLEEIDANLLRAISLQSSVLDQFESFKSLKNSEKVIFKNLLSASASMALHAISEGGSSEVAFAESLRDFENSSVQNGENNFPQKKEWGKQLIKLYNRRTLK